MVKVSVDGQEGDLGAAAALIGAGRVVRLIGAGLLAAAHRHRHCVKAISKILPLRRIFSFSQTDSALTTETPTPCRPPETL